MCSLVDDHFGVELDVRNILWWLFWGSRGRLSLRCTALLGSSIVFRNLGVLDRSLLGSGLLDTVSLGLFGGEALRGVRAHGTRSRSALNESNHGAIALRVEGAV